MRNVHDALTALYRRAKNEMPADELGDVARVLKQEAESAALNLSEIVGGVACLVKEDGQRQNSSGAFQDADSVFTLLWGVSQQLDCLAALICIGNEADSEAHQRRELAAVPAQPKKGRAAS